MKNSGTRSNRAEFLNPQLTEVHEGIGTVKVASNALALQVQHLEGILRQKQDWRFLEAEST